MAIHTLSDLLGVENEAAFRASFADKIRWHAAMELRANVADLLPWSILDMLLGGAAVPPEKIRVLINNNEILHHLYADEKGRVRPAAMQRFTAQGATLTINDIGQFVPVIGALAAMVERALRCRTGANAYLSFGEKSAFLAHHDGHDVLILQLYGSKRWRTYGAPIAFPTSGGYTGSPPDCQWEGMMTPGDILYLPRGEIHATVPEITPSVHLTISIVEDTGVDFIRWLADRAVSAVALRRDLGATLPAEGRVTRDRELFEALRKLLDGASVAEFTAQRDRDRELRSVVAIACESRIHPEARLVSALRRPLDLELEKVGIIPLTLGQRQFRLTQDERRVLAAITAQDGITVERLAGQGLGSMLHTSIQNLLNHALIAMLE